MNQHFEVKKSIPGGFLGTTHWTDRPGANLWGSFNRVPVRISAKVLIKLNKMKNELEGTSRSLYEQDKNIAPVESSGIFK